MTKIKDLEKRLHHLERMRQDFVANVSHELRTPLTVLHGYLETLVEQTKNSPKKKIYEQMQAQTSRMERLVEDLLLLSRLEADTPTEESFKQVDVTSLLKQIIKDAKALSADRQHQIFLTTDENLKILGVEDELRSVFSNLIFNAVNYTPGQGTIDIRWFHDSQHAIFSVKDSGLGIAPEHLPRITERFYRVDRDRSRASGGTGLGLAIVKHVLLRHDAQLKIESTPGKGSCFSCIFELALS
ncbi:MAG: phoR [Gammaproteobacteria bacterium]|jgi:two-component system phosphate regulon sensor histidine kinase PhoR|nr:phoR [Gammaproteobacteria bacterium]